MLGLCLLALGLRLYRLPDANVWWDEGYEIALARESLGRIAWVTAADVHPPLHYWLLHLWSRLAGESPFAGRFLSVWWGVLAAPLTYWLGRRLLSSPVALLAAALVTLSRFHVEWSQQIRMYTLAIDLAILALGWAFAWWQGADRATSPPDPLPDTGRGSPPRALSSARQGWGHRTGGRQRRAEAPGIAVVTALGLANLYLSILVPLVQTLVVTLFALAPVGGKRIPRARLRGWLATLCVAAALYLPWFLFFLSRPRFQGRALATVDLGTFLWAYLTALPLGISAYLDRYLPLAIPAALLLLLGAGAGLAARVHQRATALCLALLVVPPFLVYAMTFPNPLFSSPNLFVRYLILFLPAYHLLLGLALATLWRWPAVGLAAGTFLIGIHLWALADYYPSRRLADDYQTVARFIQAYARPGDAVLLNSDRNWPIFVSAFPSDLPRYGVGTETPTTAASAAASLGPLVARHPGIWLVTSDESYDADPEGHVPRWLTTHAHLAGELSLPHRKVALYTTTTDRDLRGQTTLLPDVPRDVTFLLAGRELLLVGYDQPLRDAIAGETIPLALFWRAEGSLQDCCDLRLRLRDRDRDLQIRRLPIRPGISLDRLVGTHRADYPLSVPAALPPGRYPLEIEVVDRDSGEAMPVLGGGRRAVRLGVIDVRPSAPERSPTPSVERDARVGPFFRLVGYDLASDSAADSLHLRPGAALTVHLHWRDEAATEHRYTVFVQLVGDQENPATRTPVWAQHDGYPQEGRRPTDTWVPGERVLDRHPLTLPASMPPGRYCLIVGMYDLATGERLTVSDESGSAGDHVALDDVVVGSDLTP